MLNYGKSLAILEHLSTRFVLRGSSGFVGALEVSRHSRVSVSLQKGCLVCVLVISGGSVGCLCQV